ncbi:hypothetical protein ACNQK4_000254 [Staphylococcus pseudintermedius]|uniref:hypothetical protein n=1 Tax=Staphylococcus pseudintermedius TaxID=283734 RepID=UPI001FFD4B80|nr:hypothetical protein [Staphylococcus pseudintermedius]MDE9957709.1 hypothetical protein [Staphylococcus pseudintermedius]MDE9983320.1 hypothetical protein [Staphylococcus pseudintermedius]MDE9985427.1 hypothetical protein [Staphylococcus pseudintermedius]MDE9988027.1 hypothetical protein [Staphylococcus pseudintermedius]MDF0000058.1 hypothetical protein [Staphylococcus pseudintermedius]
MNVQEIIEKFYLYGKRRGFHELKEGKVVREYGSETLFNMSAISEHIDLFDELSSTESLEKYVTKQLSYFPNKLDGVGFNRLTNPMEIGLSFLVKNSKYPIDIVNQSLGFIETIGLLKNKMYIRCDKEVDFLGWYVNTGIPKDNIYEWENIEKFHIGKHRPTGNYSYLYYKYLNGIVPFGAVAIIKKQNNYYFDIVFYAERLAMILERKEAIWQIDEINFLAPVIENLEINTSNKARFTLFFRILVLLIHGGLGIASNKKHGYFLKRILRELAFLLDGKTISESYIRELSMRSSDIVLSLGYTDLNDDQRKQVEQNMRKINHFSVDIIARLKKVESLITYSKSIDFDRLKSEFGIFPEWVVSKYSELLLSRGIQLTLNHRNSIRSLALGNDNRCVDIDKLLGEKND